MRAIFNTLTLFLALNSTVLFAAKSVTVKGETERGDKTGFTARVWFKDIPLTEIGQLSIQQYVESHVYINIKSYENGTTAPFLKPEKDALSIYEDSFEVEGSADSTKKSFGAIIKVKSGKTLELFKNDSGQIIFSACLRALNGQTIQQECSSIESDDEVVQILNHVVSEAPTNLKVTPRHLQAVMEWKVTKYPKFENVDGDAISNRAASGIYAVLIKTGEGVGALPGRTFEGEEPEDDPSSPCAFDEAQDEGGTCIVCGPKDYLDFEAIKKSSDYKAGNIKIQELKGGATVAAFSKLEVDVPYVGFVTYAPDAIARSTCFSVVPDKGYTWTEINGGISLTNMA